ncbi:MAG TPA: amidohydrolase family protein [Aggregatilineales bacterium]|nr:amidohydrolase family protein [Aggregatilineales bacterium]
MNKVWHSEYHRAIDRHIFLCNGYNTQSSTKDPIIKVMIVSYEDAVLVTPGGIRHESLVIDTRTGRILPPEMAYRAQQHIDAGQWALYPGLINAHDHLEFNHYPRTRWRERYENASQWAQNMQPYLDEEPYTSLRRLPLQDRCLIGGLKNLLSGVTTVAHHNPLHKPLKKRDFPVQVIQRYTWAHSIYLTSEHEIKKAHAGCGIFMIHLAEGTDDSAEKELHQLAEYGCLDEKTIVIHGVGLHNETQKQAIQESGGLVWCPSSNLFLLGATAAVSEWYEAGKLMLGSDSRLTADGDLLDELRAAYQTEQLNSEALFHLVTDFAANMLKLKDKGDLQPGMQADVFALPRPAHGDYYLHLIESRRTQILWVMRSGKIVWEQTNQESNCTLEGIPYRLDRQTMRTYEKSTISEPLLARHR